LPYNRNSLAAKDILISSPYSALDFAKCFPVSACLSANRRVLILTTTYLGNQEENGLGYLCGFDLTNMELFFQKNIEETV